MNPENSVVLKTPRPTRLLRELRSIGEPLRLVPGVRKLLAGPRGSGRPVMVLPGFGAGNGSMALLRAYLRRMGHDVRGWPLGRNNGNVADMFPKVLSGVEQFAKSAGQPVTLVGWSLGGYLSREVARKRPDLVSLVVTLGTPVEGGPKYTVFAGLYKRWGYDLDELERKMGGERSTPITTPTVAVYSKNDGIVDWRACLDRHTGGVEHVEVRTGHLFMGFSPETFRVVAERLARD
ncbi:MAG: esterase/lipase family protein [Desulfatibacillaceae bacterium]